MLPVTQLAPSEAQGLQGLIFDLDDTVLDHGKLSEAAYRSLFRLQDSGLQLIALTGRPASWAELVARMWPVTAAIGENGAIAFLPAAGGLRRMDSVSAEERQQRTIKLHALVTAARVAIPLLSPADDVAGRCSDFTFDIGEHCRASEETIRHAIAFAADRGARTTRSSVHLHYTFDRIDKATGALALLSNLGVDATSALTRYAFIGDSENDAPCFAAFRTTIGVQNLKGSFSLLPRFVTRAPGGAGFAEAAQHLCERRALLRNGG